MENKIIGLDLSTKIQYSLFNFFAPISFVAILIVGLDLYNIKATLFAFLSIVFSFFIFLINIIRYNRYIVINETSITICTRKKHPKIIKIIKKATLANKTIGPDFSITDNGKKVKLLHYAPSIVGLICWIGPLMFIPILKRNNVFSEKISEIKALLPEIVENNFNQENKTSNTMINVLMWGFVLFVTALGCLGIFLSPYYASMK